MHVGIFELDGEAHIDVYGDLERFEINAHQGNGKVVTFIGDDDHPACHKKGLAVLGSLVDLDQGDDTACNALEYLLRRLYNLGVANGKAEAFSQINALANRHYQTRRSKRR